MGNRKEFFVIWFGATLGAALILFTTAKLMGY